MSVALCGKFIAVGFCTSKHYTQTSISKLYDYFYINSGIALGYGMDDRGFDSRRGLGIFLFTTASRPALEPTKPPI